VYAGTGGFGVFRSRFPTTNDDDDDTNTPAFYRLEQNYPNPFNPSTRIQFQVQSSEFVSLKLYDLLGREVATLVSEEMKPGRYERRLDGSGLASGVYIYRLQAGGFIQSRKLLLLR
jgi:hypothetical protein